jgi:putative ABC transport system permease protein
MNPISRGIRNAFRSGVRTGSIVLILGLSIGLSLTMLVAQKAVDSKIKSVKSSIGTAISISPAGFNPGSQANNALTVTQLDKVKSLPHVASITENLTDRLPTTGASMPSFGRFGAADSSSSTTSLTSPITIGTADANTALISETMASKNNLKVGDTFTAYDTALTVGGIFSTSTQGAQDTVVVSLPTMQRLSGQTSVVTNATATVDSLDNLSGTTAAIKSALGSSNADVTSAQDQADQAVEPLNSVKKVATFSLVGAITAGAVIILLTMIMVVRERKKEIGVVKAIGGSNLRIVSEFMVESLTLAVLGAVIGLLIGVVGGQPVTKQLVSSSTQNTASHQGPENRSFGLRDRAGGMSGSGDRPILAGGLRGGFRRNSAVQGLTNINAQIGWSILLEGFGAAVLIAVIGSALAAGMISKVRPSTVMRAE